jgi:lipid-A-disaccharide synthase
MRYYVIAGEASGDLHGANLIKSLKAEDDSAVIRGWGGDLMAAAGTEVVKHYRELAFMGFWEVLKNLPTILRNFKNVKRDILDWKPDVLILIDYPGFNLRMAKWAKMQGIRVFYYISPQLWAWHSSRVHIIKSSVERMFVILPFEKQFYQNWHCEVDFVGHPLLDVVEQFSNATDFIQKNNLDSRPIIALLPGSRRQEIQSMLSVMLKVVPAFPNYQFVIAGAPSVPRFFYDQILYSAGISNVTWIENQTYAILSLAKAALVTSGTATLETALFNVPQVVCYRGNPISFFIARHLVKVDAISLVNLIAGKSVVRELIQHFLTPENLQQALKNLLDEHHAAEIQKEYRNLRQKLGNKGASNRTARLMVSRLRNESIPENQ